MLQVLVSRPADLWCMFNGQRAISWQFVKLCRHTGTDRRVLLSMCLEVKQGSCAQFACIYRLFPLPVAHPKWIPPLFLDLLYCKTEAPSPLMDTSVSWEWRESLCDQRLRLLSQGVDAIDSPCVFVCVCARARVCVRGSTPWFPSQCVCTRVRMFVVMYAS